MVDITLKLYKVFSGATTNGSEIVINRVLVLSKARPSKDLTVEMAQESPIVLGWDHCPWTRQNYQIHHNVISNPLCITFKSLLCICLEVLIIVSRTDRSSDNYIELEDLEFNFRMGLVKLGSARDIVELLQIYSNSMSRSLYHWILLTIA